MRRHGLIKLTYRLLSIVLCLAFVSPAWSESGEVLPVDLAQRQFGHDWPTFLGPTLNGKSLEVNIDFDWPAKGPPIVWQTPLGQSYSAPSISRGRLFHFDRYGEEDRLICREAETGKKIWTVSFPTRYKDMLGYNGGPRCTPVVDGARVYTFSAEGFLRCHSAESGDLRWEVDTRKQFHVVKNFFGVASTPLVYGDHLIVNVGGSPPDGPSDVWNRNRRLRQTLRRGGLASGRRIGQLRKSCHRYDREPSLVFHVRPWWFGRSRSHDRKARLHVSMAGDTARERERLYACRGGR